MMIGQDSYGGSSVPVRKEELLKKLKENRLNHRSIFEEACEKYREAAIRELDNMLSDAKANKKIRKVLALEEPQDHTKDYDRVIVMLEMCTKDEITISEEEFTKYVMDDWTWKHQFTSNATSYTGKSY